MSQITSIENDNFDSFVYEAGHFQDKNGLDTVLDAEKSIYGRDKILTEQEIDEILSEGYIEWNFYVTGDEILEDDRVRVKGSDIEWEVWDFDEDKEKIVVVDVETFQIEKEVDQEQLTLLRRAVSQIRLKKQKINFKLKF